MGRVKEETIKVLFVKVFNRIYDDQARLLGDYKAKLEKEKLSEFDNERIAKLDEDIERLIQQERALFLIEEKGYADHNLVKIEHEEMVLKLTQLQTERSNCGIVSKNIPKIFTVPPSKTLSCNAICGRGARVYSRCLIKSKMVFDICQKRSIMKLQIAYAGGCRDSCRINSN